MVLVNIVWNVFYHDPWDFEEDFGSFLLGKGK